ncbi:hypothetical protein D3C75_999320 [compost metagenome]
MCYIQRKSPVQSWQRLTRGILKDNIAVSIFIVSSLYNLVHIVAPVYKRCPINTRMLAIPFNNRYGVSQLLIIQIIPIRIHVNKYIAVIIEILQILFIVIGDIHYILIRKRTLVSSPAIKTNRYALWQLGV